MKTKLGKSVLVNVLVEYGNSDNNFREWEKVVGWFAILISSIINRDYYLQYRSS